jgi:DNA-binding transcriptional LysR family regulator
MADGSAARLDIALLPTFLAVYRAGSLTAAARQVGLSQPTVTAQLRTLEERLGNQLFERLPRGVRATPVADELARRVARHVDALTSVARRGLPGDERLTTPVHLGGPAELVTYRVVPALGGLVEAGLPVRITVGLADDLLAGLAAGRLDMVVSTVRPRSKALASTPLADEEFVLVAAPDRAATIDLGGPTAARYVDPGPLRDQPLLSYGEELPIIRRYWRSVFGTRPSGSAALVVPDLRAVRTAAVAGLGITVLPSYLCAEDLDTGRLVALLEPELPPINTFHLVTRAGTAQLPHLAAVAGALRESAPSW